MISIGTASVDDLQLGETHDSATRRSVFFIRQFLAVAHRASHDEFLFHATGTLPDQNSPIYSTQGPTPPNPQTTSCHVQSLGNLWHEESNWRAQLVTTSINTWIAIPARGGSVGIPRKNVRQLAGRPLIVHVITTAILVVPARQVIVITDDQEIARIAAGTGVEVVVESAVTPPQETLDTKIVRNLGEFELRGADDDSNIITIQPTSPLLRTTTLRRTIKLLNSDGVGCVISAVDDRHLRWRQEVSGRFVPEFSKRVNRQLLPPSFRETGGILAARLGDIRRRSTRIIEPVSILTIDPDEGVDIDNFADLRTASYLLSRKKIAIRVDAAIDLGMGHAYRMLSLALELASHEIRIYTRSDRTLGAEFFSQYPVKVTSVIDETEFTKEISEYSPDLVVRDLLDSTIADIDSIRSAAPNAKIVTFEDTGPGAALCDLLVAEFVTNEAVPASRMMTGIEYSILSPAFETVEVRSRAARPQVDEILVLFGGTDPSGLAVRVLHSLHRVGFSGHVTVVRGLGAEPVEIEAPCYSLTQLNNVVDMPALMRTADLAFTSAGRTIVELIECSVPAICLAQNAKELTHSHANAQNGVVNLGLGTALSDASLDQNVRSILSDRSKRSELHEAAANSGSKRSNIRTIKELLTRVDLNTLDEL